MKVYVIHPFFEESHRRVIEITDCMDENEFYDRWDELPDQIQAEFGYDYPIATLNDLFHLFTVVQPDIVMLNVLLMTFDEYVMLVQLTALSE